MKKIDILAVLETLENCEAELEELQNSEDWFVSPALERIPDAKERLYEELEDVKSNGKPI